MRVPYPTVPYTSVDPLTRTAPTETPGEDGESRSDPSEDRKVYSESGLPCGPIEQVSDTGPLQGSEVVLPLLRVKG